MRIDARRIASSLVAIVLGMLCAAPTVGDVGGCGDEPEDMTGARFAGARKKLDCQRCQECGIGTQRCAHACDPRAASDSALPDTCHLLVHDAEVCLRVLLSFSCTDFAAAVDDFAPRTPSECHFCRDGTVDAAAPAFVGDEAGDGS